MKVRLDNVRFSYVYLDEPKTSDKPGKDASYEVTAILDEKDNAEDLKKIREALDTFKGHAKFGGKKPSKLCLRKGDDTEARAEDPALGPHKFTVSARRKAKDGRCPITNKSLTPINPREVYSGCFGILLVSLYPWLNTSDGTPIAGISAEILAVVKTGEGDPLTSRVEANMDSDFADLAASEEL